MKRKIDKSFFSVLVTVTLVLVLTIISYWHNPTTVYAAKGEGTATISDTTGTPGVEGPIMNVTAERGVSDLFTEVLTVGVSGIATDAASPTFNIPPGSPGFTAPDAAPVANVGLVVADGNWFMTAAGGTCAITPSASGQTITVDVTGACASGDTITLTYKGTRSGYIGSTQPFLIYTADTLANGAPVFLSAGSPGVFVDDTVDPTLSSISIVSDNSDTTLAKVGDTISLTFTSSETIQTPTVVFSSGGNLVTNTATPTNVGGNNWSVDYIVNPADTNGLVTFTLNYADVKGNAGTQETLTDDDSTVTVDATIPVVVSYSPANGATGVAVNSNLVLAFNENVQVGTGNVVIYKASGDSVVETIDITSGLVAFNGTTGVTINPTANLLKGTSYYVEIDNTAITDNMDNVYAGIANKTTWSFTVVKAASGGGSAPSFTTKTEVPGCGDRTTGYSMSTGQSCATNIPHSEEGVNNGQNPGGAGFQFTLLLRLGSKGNEVMELQKFLSGLVADGKFGPKTKAAVIKFQLANKLVGDGVVGPRTRAVLNK